MKIQLSNDNAANKVLLSDLRRAVRGRHREIADAAGVHYVTVSRVLNGVYINEKVIDAACDIRDKYATVTTNKESEDTNGVQ